MSDLNLYQKLIEIKKCLPRLKKDAKGYNYNYVSGASVLAQIQDKMNELGVLLVPSVTGKNLHLDHYEATNSYGKTATKEVRIVEADMIMTWIDAESKEKFEVPWLCFGEQDDASKAFGSGLTYSERYFLLKFFNVPTDEDDPDAGKEKAERKQKPPKQDVPDFTPETAVDALKKILSAKMGKMSPNDKKAFYAYCTADKEVTVDLLQGVIDNYDEFKEGWDRLREASE